ncbi:hypothetical protein FC695_29340, partial [Bacillus cereus]
TDSAVDVGATAGAAATGAVVGSFFLPPIGTAVGAGVGIAATVVLNGEWFGGESIVSATKKGIKSVTNNGIESATKKLKALFW